MNDKYISGFKIKKEFDVTSETLRRWTNQNSIRSIRTQDGKGKRLYLLEDVYKMFGIDRNKELSRETVCYARVSSSHQKEDLSRQIQVLTQAYPQAKIISDIGSGINFKRNGLTTLLQRIYKREIEKIVVADKDRLCRFGFDLFQWILDQTSTKLVVLNEIPHEKESDFTRELADDLLAVTNYFVARNNGYRAARNRKERKKQEEKKQATAQKSDKLEGLSV